MKRLAAIAGSLLLGCSSAPAPVTYPEACMVCPDGGIPSEAGVFHDDGMLAARWAEVSPTIESHLTLTNGEPHVHTGLAIEGALALARDDRVRLIADLGLSGGALGDTQHGYFFFEGGGGLKVSFLPDAKLFDVYGMWTAGVIGGAGGLPAGQSLDGAVMLGTGIGLRVFRAIALEGTFHMVGSLDAPFVPRSGGPSAWIPQMGLGVRFDFCSLGTWCNRAPLVRKSTDQTCAVYENATSLCRAAQRANERRRLCASVLESMSTSDRRPPTLPREAVGLFLEALAAGVPTKLHDGAASLVKQDDCLVAWRACGRHRECILSQRGERADEHRVYAPYVLELMTALGCDERGEPTKACDYTCEDPLHEPSVCAP